MLGLSRKAVLGALMLVLLLSLTGAPSLAQEALSPRLQIGIGILPAIIAANKRLANDDTQTLPIYLVYRDNRHLAEQIRARLEAVGKIRKRGLRIESIAVAELLASNPLPAGTIFLAQPMGDDLGDLLGFAQQKRVLLFSPFKGDVERGVSTGFRVTDKVLPMVNMTSLQKSNIQLKAFFLRVAVKYE